MCAISSFIDCLHGNSIASPDHTPWWDPALQLQQANLQQKPKSYFTKFSLLMYGTLANCINTFSWNTTFEPSQQCSATTSIQCNTVLSNQGTRPNVWWSGCCFKYYCCTNMMTYQYIWQPWFTLQCRTLYVKTAEERRSFNTPQIYANMPPSGIHPLLLDIICTCQLRRYN